MADLNEVMFTGNLGKDPKLAMTKNGKARCTASLGVGSVEKDRNGENVKTTTWYTLVAFEKTAELLGNLKKGQALFVKGSLRQRKFKAEDGVEKEYLELAVRRLDPLDRAAFNSSPAFSEEELAEEPAF